MVTIILPKTSENSALTGFFQTSKNLKLVGEFGDLQEALITIYLCNNEDHDD